MFKNVPMKSKKVHRKSKNIHMESKKYLKRPYEVQSQYGVQKSPFEVSDLRVGQFENGTIRVQCDLRVGRFKSGGIREQGN